MSRMVEMEITSNHLPELAKLAIIMRVYITPKMEEIGQTLRKGAVDSIRQQAPMGGGSWQPLSAKHLKWKMKRNYSTNIYTMTSTYVQNIASVYNPATMTLEVGVFRGVMHPGAKDLKAKELATIAEVLEYGYAPLKIPARPLWRPLLDWHEHSIRTKIGIALAQALKYVQSHMPPAPGGTP